MHETFIETLYKLFLTITAISIYTTDAKKYGMEDY